MSRREWGSLEQRANGRWRIRYREGGRKRSLPNTFASKREAEQHLEELRRSKVDRTIATYGPEWLDEREDAGQRGMVQERNRWMTHIATAPFADKALEEITRVDVNRWVDQLARKHVTRTVTKRANGKKEVIRTEIDRRLSRKSVRNVLNLLSTFLSDCARYGFIAENVSRGVRIPDYNPSPRDPWTYLTLEEIDQLLNCEAVSFKARVFYAVSIYAGLRKGEVAALRWEDVHLEEAKRPRIRVRYGSTDWTAPKAKRVKDVPLLLPLRQLLRAWRERDDAVRTSGLVFHDADGRAHKSGYDAGFRGNLKRAGIMRHVRPHDLRHTCASHLVMGSWGRPYRLEEVRDWLRHQSVMQTERYAHLAPDRLDGARADTDQHWTASQLHLPNGRQQANADQAACDDVDEGRRESRQVSDG